MTTNKITDISKDNCNDINLENISLTYNYSFEEEIKESSLVERAEWYLASMGIKVRTNYGYYRDTYDILKDLGEYLSKPNIPNLDN